MGVSEVDADTDGDPEGEPVRVYVGVSEALPDREGVSEGVGADLVGLGLAGVRVGEGELVRV